MLRPTQQTVAAAVLALATAVQAEDWPTYLHDAQRSGVATDGVQLPLHERWVWRSYEPPKPAWADPQPKPVEGNLELPRLRFDDAFHAVIAGDTVYFGSSVEHTIYALDADTGQVRWRFFTSGPVRFAPTARDGRVYAGSDDGMVYCLDADSGELIWDFPAAPFNQRVLGNGQLISLWPVRTNVMIDDGIAYFAAGIFPAEGLYLHAVDAGTGRQIWVNDTFAEGGNSDISPQGYIIASKDRLFVPSGRTVPGAFDRRSGRGLYQTRPNWRRDGLFGGTHAFLAEDCLYNGTERILAYAEQNGKLERAYEARRALVSGDTVYLATGDQVLSVHRTRYPEAVAQQADAHKQLEPRAKLEESIAAARKELQALKEKNTRTQLAELTQKLVDMREGAQARPSDIAEVESQRETLSETLIADARREEELARQIESAEAKVLKIDEAIRDAGLAVGRATHWSAEVTGCDAMIMAGGILYLGDAGAVRAVDGTSGELRWQAPVNGRARGLAVASGQLYVSTDDGAIHCFGTKPEPPGQPVDLRQREEYDAFTLGNVSFILKDGGIDRGYALVLGGGLTDLVELLVERTALRIVAVEPDEEKARAMRSALAFAQRFGSRVTVINQPLDDLGSLPDYFANLIIEGESLAGGPLRADPREVLRLLKPCGGVLYAGRPERADGQSVSASDATRLGDWLEDASDASTRITMIEPTWGRITRGELKGSGTWTHQYGDTGNTACSRDDLVVGSLGMLWFGEPGPTQMPSRHAANVSPLAINGRMFVQGEHVIMAYDAYNGLQYWERKIEGAERLGMKWRTDSSNLCASQDSLFVAIGQQCMRLDQATGQTRRTYEMPTEDNSKTARWGYIAYLAGTLYGSRTCGDGVSDRLFAIDADSGKPRWIHEGRKVAHDSIAIGDGRYFFVESEPTDAQRERAVANGPGDAVNRKGQSDIRVATAIDANTGEFQWDHPLDVSDCVRISRGGGDLSAMYSKNILLLFAAPWNGHFWSEFFKGEFSRRSIIALAGDTGKLMWTDNVGYRSRPLIVGDTIYAEPWARDLCTGKPKTRENPLTGKDSLWQMARPGHHCGCIAASNNTLFFRSWSMASYDLESDSGTLHYGGQRPGCWINFIPAGGVVLIPEASSGCVCPFSVHCTVVMHPRKENRVWGMYSIEGARTPVEHLAINFGAPGDRKDDRGTLWLGYPRPRNDRLVFDLDLNDKMQPGGFYDRRNAEHQPVAGTDTPWVFSSFCRGMHEFTVPLLGESDEPRRYTVRLLFAEPDDAQPGQRLSDLALQGKRVLEQFDVTAEAGGNVTAVVKQFDGIEVEGDLVVSLTPSEGARIATSIISGIEVLAE